MVFKQGFKTGLKFPDCEPDFSCTMAQLYDYAAYDCPGCPLAFAQVPYRLRRTTENEQIDDLHDEVLPANRIWQDGNILPMWVQAQPKRQELSRFGIDEPRELEIRIALPVLEAAGLVIQRNAQEFVGGTLQDIVPNTKENGALIFLTDLGDRILYQGFQYDVLSMHLDQFWGNTSIPMWQVGFCNKTRPNTTTDVTLDDSTEDWRDDPLNPINNLN